MFIDCHSHLDELQKSNKNIENYGVDSIITSGYNAISNNANIQIANQNLTVFTTVGIHPHFVDEFNESAFLKLIEKSNKIVGIGEIGFDINSKFCLEQQIDIFVAQVNIARKFDLPVVIHLNGFENEFVDIATNIKLNNFMLHRFSGNSQLVKYALDKDALFSIAGNITYKKNALFRKTLQEIPLNKIVIETDSPYCLPSTIARGQRNQPENIKFVASELCKIYNCDLPKIAKITSENAKKFFNL